TSLGVAAALTGTFFGALLQNRWVLLTIGILIGLLSLSLFGVYTFQLPTWLVQRAGEQSHRKGLIGLFLSGLFVGVFAAPCIGPPIIALLTFVGTRQDPFFAFSVFFILSLGLGAPYLVLGTFSGLLRRLPKSGTWLVWVEKLFGVILLALSLFYILLAVYPKALTFFGPWERVIWEPYAVEKLETAKAESKKVIIDFFADWCIPCHELDQFTYSDKKVIEGLADFVRLKVDLTEADTKEAQDAAEKFDIIGVPTILLLNEKGEEYHSARTTGFVSAKEFLEILETLNSNHET
ncbi:MAG: cytochrome c biogenesis protein CcdA, partial [bacterium]|nr:cytochrome c biogenesis protein CcdA [bacterium]